MNSQKFNHIVVGGTFDRLHEGHKYLLETAIKLGKKISIGITSDFFASRKITSVNVESYQIRRQQVTKYIASKKNAFKVNFFKLEDIYGTTLIDPTIDSILVTNETYPNALKINTKRKSKNLPPLKIIKISYKKGNDKKIISSTRIRSGEINREGESYKYIYKGISKLFLPAELRKIFRQPIGKVFRGSESKIDHAAKAAVNFLKKTRPSMVIVVGDVASHSFKKVGFKPDLIVVDFKTHRHKITLWNVDHINSVNINPAGTVTASSSEAIRKLIKKHTGDQVIRIKGEEDLLTMSAILHAPLHSSVVYGQTNIGIIVVEVTEVTKKFISDLLKKFTH